MKFGLTEAQYLLLIQLVALPIEKVGGKIWIFGTRARGDHKQFSDIDLLIELPKDISSSRLMGAVKDDLENSRLPFKVDLVQVQDLAESYRAGVLAERVVLKGTQRPSI